MADVESAGDWCRRVCRSLPPCDLNSIMARNALREALEQRDAAIREAARREAFEEAAEWVRALATGKGER